MKAILAILLLCGCVSERPVKHWQPTEAEADVLSDYSIWLKRELGSSLGTNSVLWHDTIQWSITDTVDGSNVTFAVEFGFESGGGLRWRRGRIVPNPVQRP